MVYTNDLVKVNGNFSSTQKAIDYTINPEWQNRDALWAFVSASQEGIGKVIYEHISNLVQNVRDIDTCGLHQLYSIAQELDVDQIFSYDLQYPVDLEELMNNLSTQRSFTVVSGYILDNYTLDDIYHTVGTDVTQEQYYDLSGNITLSEYATSTGTIYSLPWQSVNPNYYSEFATNNIILMSNTSNFTSGMIAKVTDSLNNIYYGQCNYIQDDTFINVIGTTLPSSGIIQKLEYSDNIININDNDYITGFLEPLLYHHLDTYANYSEKTDTTWTEQQIDTFYQEFSGVVDRNELDYLAQAGQLSTRAIIAKQYQGFMDDIYYDPSTVYSETTSAEIIEYCTHVLRNICVRASYQRETLKTIAQKHAMIGSTHALEKLIAEYILRSFTKKEGWRLYVEPDGTTTEVQNAYQMESYLPPLASIYGQFDTKVIEYWDNTEYMNISAESPYICGVTGYTDVVETTSMIDISGNLLTGNVTGSVPVYSEGLCGYIVTGGNTRFWEGENLYDAILMSETNSAEVSAFYARMGMTGTLEDMYNFQSYLWNMYAVSGLNRMAEIPDLTGTPTSAYLNTPISEIPSSGWIVSPTSLSAIHKKYIGVISGDVPPNNWKNQQYPTMAPQPFIWNLVEKIVEEFPKIFQTLLYTEQSTLEQLSSQVDINGNLIDSWKYFNHEYIGYNTNYEQSKNLDYLEHMNPDIDRDGPFHVDALSAYINYIKNNPYSLVDGMSGFYDHIERHFSLTDFNSPNIAKQLTTFTSDVLNLSGKHIFQYAYDHLDNHFMLYKDDDEFETPGQLWCRYRNHPIPFPMSKGILNEDHILQQVYMYDGGTEWHRSLESVYNSKCYDFGIFGNLMWIFGEDTVDNTNVTDPNDFQSTSPRFMMFELNNVYDPDTDELRYSMVYNTLVITPTETLRKEDFIGVYMHQQYIILVYLQYFDTVNGTATFTFKHYDRNLKKFVVHPRESVFISGVWNTVTERYDPMPPVYTNINTNDHLWKLSVSEELVTIAYESQNSVYPSETDFDNSITTIDLYKDTLSDNFGDYNAYEWKYIMENM